MKIEFECDGSRFSALTAAHRWCREHGISYGATTARYAYVGLMIGEYSIAKWHNLSAKERSQLHGWLDVGEAHDPVRLTIKPEYETLLNGLKSND